MLHIILIIILILTGVFCFDRIFLWAEEKGYLFYRNKKSDKSAIGTALLELQRFLNPAARYTIEMHQNVVKHKKREEDVPGDLKE